MSKTLNTIFISNTKIHIASQSDFDEIKKLIQKFELDNRDLAVNQFLIAEQHNLLLGFGRIREHQDCSELCSLGVIETNRLQGFGKKLVSALITKAQQPLYLVCIIPDFFVPFGFRITKVFPKALQEKLDYCTAELMVPETYVVMKYDKTDL